MFSLVNIALTEGINEALWILSPFNLASFIVNILSLSPAVLCFWLASKYASKKDEATSQKENHEQS